jgi:hypothetical protein
MPYSGDFSRMLAGAGFDVAVGCGAAVALAATVGELASVGLAGVVGVAEGTGVEVGGSGVGGSGVGVGAGRLQAVSTMASARASSMALPSRPEAAGRMRSVLTWFLHS